MAYKGFKDLARRTAFDKDVRDKAFNIAKSRKYYGYKRGLASTVNKFFDKNPKVVVLLCFQTMGKLKNYTNQLLKAL